MRLLTSLLLLLMMLLMLSLVFLVGACVDGVGGRGGGGVGVVAGCGSGACGGGVCVGSFWWWLWFLFGFIVGGGVFLLVVVLVSVLALVCYCVVGSGGDCVGVVGGAVVGGVVGVVDDGDYVSSRLVNYRGTFDEGVETTLVQQVVEVSQAEASWNVCKHQNKITSSMSNYEELYWKFLQKHYKNKLWSSWRNFDFTRSHNKITIQLSK